MNRIILPAILLVFVVFQACSSPIESTTKVIAHRGFWKTETSAQNSRASAQKAIEAQCWGSEIDIYITTDGQVVLFHDATLNEQRVDNCSYAQLQEHRLANGETLPLLSEILPLFTTQDKTKLIIELKAHDTPEKEKALVAKTLELVKAAKAEAVVEYISFSLLECETLIALDPDAKVSYLNADLNPAQLKEKGFSGLDYHMNVLRDKHPEWIQQAHDLGLTVNVWTVNKAEDMQYFKQAGADFITTDMPLEAIALCAQ